MQSKRGNTVITLVLGLISVVVLLLNRPTSLGPSETTLAVPLILLIAFTYNMGVLLTRAGEISPAHLFAIMAALSLPMPTAIWITAAGALLGGLMQVARTDEWLPRRRVTARSLATTINTIAHQTLTLLAAIILYRAAGGRIPLGYTQPGDIWPIVIFAISYSAIYLLFFALRVRMQGRALSSVLAEDWVSVGSVLLLPIPFAILSTVVYTDLDNLSLLILMGGLVLVVIGVYGLSRMRYYSQQQVEELSSISVVSQALRSNLDLDTLLETIYSQVSSLLNINDFSVALTDPAHRKIRFPLVIRQNERQTLPERLSANTLLDYVIEHQAPLLIERNVAKTAAEMGCTAPDETQTSWLGVPLLAADRALGAITVGSNDPDHPLSTVDRRLLMNIAAQAGIAIENAQLYGQAQNRAHQLATLNNISMLLAGSLSPEKVVNLVVSSVAGIANADAVALYMNWDGVYHLTRNVGLSNEFSDHALAPYLAEADPGQQTFMVTDAQSDLDVDPTLRALMKQEGKRAWIELRLISGDQPEGVVVAYYNQPHVFQSEELDLLRTFTVQAAMAIKNARIYTSTDIALDQRINQIQALYDIGQQLTATLNLQQLFKRVLEYALSGTQSDAGVVVVGAENRQGVEIVAHRGYPEGAFDSPMLETGITSRVFASGQATLVPDVRQDQYYRAVNPETCSQLSVPIKRANEILGVITIESVSLNAFGDNDITYVSQMAIQAAIAIENARLFKRVAESRDRLQVILDSMTEGILLIDQDGTAALANPRIASLLGVSPSALTSQPIDELMLESGSIVTKVMGFSTAELRLLLANLRAGEWDPVSGESVTYEIDTMPHRVFINRHSAPVRDAQGQLIGVLLVFADQTEEQELAHAREDLSRMIVHDLRSPLTAVTASLKLLHDLAPPDGEYTPIVYRTTEASSRAVRKLLNLVDSLLDIGKMESGQLALEREPIHLKTVANSVISELNSLARELDINLEVIIPDELPLLDIDAGHIERVVLNLLDNALKFTPADGTVCLRAFPPGQSSVPDNLVRVEVSDTGPGIPDEYKERLFNRFVQVENSRGRRRGTGLGLTFCRLSVEAHRGRIWIEDNPAGGAVFAFTLPVANLPATDAATLEGKTN